MYSILQLLFLYSAELAAGQALHCRDHVALSQEIAKMETFDPLLAKYWSVPPLIPGAGGCGHKVSVCPTVL